MDYKKQLSLFSEAILDLKKKNTEVFEIIEEQTADRFNIYQKNYTSHVFTILSEDFPAVKKYLGENNFMFFAQKHLHLNGVNSPSISGVSVGFKNFLIHSFDIHEDELVESLAKIDLMWSHGTEQNIEVASGCLEYWQELMFNKKSSKVINLSELVKLSLIDYKGEQAFKVIT